MTALIGEYQLDAAIGIKWVMTEVDSAAARHLRDDFRNHLHRSLASVPGRSRPTEAPGLHAGRRGFESLIAHLQSP
jgi:hypothetical protein